MAFHYGDQRYQMIYWRDDTGTLSRSGLGTEEPSPAAVAAVAARLKSLGAMTGTQEAWINDHYDQHNIPQIESVTPIWLGSSEFHLSMGGELGTLIYKQTTEGIVLTNHPEYWVGVGAIPPPPPPKQDLTMIYVAIGIVAVVLIVYGVWRMRKGAKKNGGKDS